MGKGRVTGAEDAIVPEFDAEFLFECLFQVDLGDDAEAFLLQDLGRTLHRFIESKRQRLGEIIAHCRLHCGTGDP